VTDERGLGTWPDDGSGSFQQTARGTRRILRTPGPLRTWFVLLFAGPSALILVALLISALLD